MKCPKCGYLGFDETDRCRNCNYEFALARNAPQPELALKAQAREPVTPIDDELSFLKEASPGTGPRAATPDLPLFEPLVDDTPLITKASPPRQPLAVRRTTPDAPRLRGEPKPQSFELGFDTGPSAALTRIAADAKAPGEDDTGAGPATIRDAGVVARFFAVAIDLVILALVDAAVVYLTMQICGLNMSEVALLPKVPLIVFLIVQNGGYLVAFTAGGQTLGKMALGIRVVTAEEAEPLGVGRAGLRTFMWALLAVPAGLGFVTALLRADHRGLHDRFAGTRVVRASA
jgi:uncharacterized RDD family membrane protein YckC